MKKQGLTTFMLLLPVLVFSTVASEMILIGRVGLAEADSVIAAITVGTGPYGDLFDPANGYVYTANGNHFGFPSSAPVDTGSITVIDPSTNKVITNIAEPFGHTPRELAFDSANGDIYAADVYSNTISVIDGRTNTLVMNVPAGGSITDGLAYDSRNGYMYVVNAGSGVAVLDPTTNKVIRTISVGSNPLEAVFDPANGDIYVANEGSGSVSIIDGSTNQVINTIQGVADPVQLAYDSANGNIYVAGHNANIVSIIDSRTNTLIGTLTGLPDPTGVGYDSANGNVYVGNQGSNFVSIISGETNKVIGTVTVGSGPVSPVFDPLNHNFYVTDFHSNEQPGNTVSVISTTSSAQPPDTTITSVVDGNGAPVQNSGTTLSTSIQFTFTGTSSVGVAGFECSLDGSTFSPCTSPASFNNLAAGVQHNFQVRAVDISGNRDPTPATFTWDILTPIQGIQQLIQLKHSMHLDPVTDRMLDIRLNIALQIGQNNIKSGTCLQLNVFISQVQGASSAGHLTPAHAVQLIQGAQTIEKALGC
jgi:YVTN family beta-propeller protein